jgi:alginate O-acetyltransferase complex protein AlgI
VFRANNIDMGAAWWGIVAYHFQIYFDFCGYSDMAVGLARMLGIEFIKNFNAPYHSTGLNEFWNRWHISFSTFIRDYLYFPLGGNKKGITRTYINLMIIFFVSGLWHGAKMTFVVWGLFQGVIMTIERLIGKDRVLFPKLPFVVQVILLNIIVMFSWAIFRAPSLAQGWQYWLSMVGAVHPAATSPLLHTELFTPRHIVEMLICGLFVWQTVQAHEWVKKLTTPKVAIAMVVFVYAVFVMFTQTYNPFLYFQF